MMNNDKIEDNPSFRKLKSEINQYKNIRVLLPLIRAFGGDIKQIEILLGKIPEMEQKLEELSTLPDKFNNIFSEQGWIFSESMNVDIAKIAIQTFIEKGLEEAEEILVDYYSPGWVEKRLLLLKFLPEFKDRVFLAEKACEDYKAGRYYASVLVTIALIDGWVNDLNIIEFQRKGFYSDDSELVAWDSITAHPNGLAKLQRLFSKSRKQTRTEELRIPYRNGIVHGMDLGFDNKIVAAKNWAALFAVRDWVLKIRNGELKPPPKVEGKLASLKEVIQEYQESQRRIETLHNWKPRDIKVGKNCLKKGKPGDFKKNSPERMLISFLEYWKINNFGFMAKCYAPMFNKKPIDIRQEYGDKTLSDYELVSITDQAPCVTNIQVNAKVKIKGNIRQLLFEFRLICNTKDGESANLPDEDTVWGICNRKSII